MGFSRGLAIIVMVSFISTPWTFAATGSETIVSEETPLIEIAKNSVSKKIVLPKAKKFRLKFTGGWSDLIFIKMSSSSVLQKINNLKKLNSTEKEIVFMPNLYFCAGMATNNSKLDPKLFLSSDDLSIVEDRFFTWLDISDNKEIIVSSDDFDKLKSGDKIFLTVTSDQGEKIHIKDSYKTNGVYDNEQTDFGDCLIPATEVEITLQSGDGK
jgi:hypothetical protein